MHWAFSTIQTLIQESSRLPDAMQNIGLALLAVFIPLAISLFEQADEPGYEVVDKVVKQEYILGARSFLWKIAAIFTPLLLWDLPIYQIKIVLIVIWAFGVFLMVKTLVVSYQWLREGRTERRLACLRSRSVDKDTPNLWKSVWGALGDNAQIGEWYFKVFTDLVGSLIGFPDGGTTENRRLAARLLHDSHAFFLKRPIFYLTSQDDAFGQILHWHFSVWEEEYRRISRDKDKDLEDWMGWHELSSALDEILRIVTERSVKDDHAFGFFELIKRHVQEYQLKSIQGDTNKHFYLQSLFQVFCPTFFESIHDAKDKYDIWHHYFPKEWLITKASLEDKNTLVARGLVHEFFDWAEPRIRLSGERDIDFALDDATRELFPTTDPSVWADLITLALRPWVNDKRMESLIDSPPNFGVIGRIRTFWGDYEKQKDSIVAEQEEEVRATIELAAKFFPPTFSDKQLSNYLAELESLAYPDDQKKEIHRTVWIALIKKIQSILGENSTTAVKALKDHK